MTALIVTVFTASLLGSMHCVGMCGAFVAFACAPGKQRPITLIAAYNSGRFVTYVALGAFAGLLGQAVDLGAGTIGIQRIAAVLAASVLIGFGIVSILRIKGVHIPKAPTPRILSRAVTAGHRRAMDLSPTARALTVGLLTTLLPCGWLYAFAVAAAGTGSPLLGAVTMAAFWLGTLPALIALGASLQRLAGPLAQRMPMVTSLAIVAVGLLTIAGRLPMPTTSNADTPSGIDESIVQVKSIDHQDLPCCTDEP